MLKMIDPDIDLSEMVEKSMGINKGSYSKRECATPNNQNPVPNERNHEHHHHGNFNKADRESIDE